MYDPRQQALMAQMFGTGTGAGGGQPMQPQGGPTQSGMGIAPSFDTGQIPNSFGGGGVGQPIPNWQGPPPDFSMQPFDPASGPNFQDLGGGGAPSAPPVSAGDYQPDGFFQGAAGSFDPNKEQPEQPMPSSRFPMNKNKAGGREPAPGFNPGVSAGKESAAGFLGRMRKDVMGPGVMTEGDASQITGAAGLGSDEERRRNVLIQAIMKQAQAR